MSCDSCEVGPLRDAEALLLGSDEVLLVVLPLGPEVALFPFPLNCPLPPGTELPGLGRPALLTLSQLTERLRPVLPKVRGGSGFNGTVGEEQLPEPILEPIPLLDDVARLVKPTGFWVADEAAGFPLLFCAVEFNFAVDGPAEDVLAAKAAHPVRPLVTEEETLLPEEFPDITVGGFKKKKDKYYIRAKYNPNLYNIFESKHLAVYKKRRCGQSGQFNKIRFL